VNYIDVDDLIKILMIMRPDIDDAIGILINDDNDDIDDVTTHRMVLMIMRILMI
jgi:hypothetical protein